MAGVPDSSMLEASDEDFPVAETERVKRYLRPRVGGLLGTARRMLRVLGSALVVLECEDVGQHLLGERTQFDVAFLGSPPQQVERGVGADAVDVNQHAFCLFDAGSVFGDFY